jgi:hypothetical protein
MEEEKEMKKVLVSFAGALLLASPAMAVEIPQVATQAPAYNCDYQPSCEVAPGFYGKMASPVTSKFNLSIGGFVKLDYAYNSVNLGNSGSLAPGSGAIPKTTSQQGQADQSLFTARQSRLWFKVAGPTFLGAKTNALIEADFYGDPAAANESPQMRMRLAYGTLDWATTQVLFGQFWDTFGPMVMSTVDFRQAASFGTPNNPRVPQIRLTQKVNFNDDNGLKFVLSLQDPNQDGNNNQAATTGTAGTGNTTSAVASPAAAFSSNVGMAVNLAGQAMFVSKALGVAPGFYGMSMNSLTAGVFGLWGTQKVTFAADPTKHVDSYGYGFYSFVPVLRSSDGKSRAMTLSFESQVYMAANMSFNTATATNFIGSATNPNAAKGWGLGAQMIFYPIQDLGITAGYGRRNAYNYSSYTAANFQRYNSIVFANVAYDLNAAVRLSAEYENLDTQYGNNSKGTSGTGTTNIARVAAYYFF